MPLYRNSLKLGAATLHRSCLTHTAAVWSRRKCANFAFFFYFKKFSKSESLAKVCRILINTSAYLEFCKLKAERYKQMLRNFLWQQLTARITVLRVFVKYYSRPVVVFYRNKLNERLLDAIFATTIMRWRKWRFFINAWETNSGNTCVSAAANPVVKFA